MPFLSSPCGFSDCDSGMDVGQLLCRWLQVCKLTRWCWWVGVQVLTSGPEPWSPVCHVVRKVSFWFNGKKKDAISNCNMYFLAWLSK